MSLLQDAGKKVIELAGLAVTSIRRAVANLFDTAQAVSEDKLAENLPKAVTALKGESQQSNGDQERQGAVGSEEVSKRRQAGIKVSFQKGEILAQHEANRRKLEAEVKPLLDLGINKELINQHGRDVLQIAQEKNVPLGAAAVILRDVAAANFTSAGFREVCSALNQNTALAASSKYLAMAKTIGYSHAYDDYLIYSTETDSSHPADPAIILYAKFIMMIDRDRSKLPIPDQHMFRIAALKGSLSVSEAHLEALTFYKVTTGNAITRDDLKELCGRFSLSDDLVLINHPIPAIDAVILSQLVKSLKNDESHEDISLRDLTAPGMLELTRAGILPTSISELRELNHRVLPVWAKEFKVEKLNDRELAKALDTTKFTFFDSASSNNLQSYFKWRADANKDLNSAQLIQVLLRDATLIQGEEELGSIVPFRVGAGSDFVSAYRSLISADKSLPVDSPVVRVTAAENLQQHARDIEELNIDEGSKAAIADIFGLFESPNKPERSYKGGSESKFLQMVNAESHGQDALKRLAQFVEKLRGFVELVSPEARQEFAGHIKTQLSGASSKEAPHITLGTIEQAMTEITAALEAAYNGSGEDLSREKWMDSNFKYIQIKSSDA